MFVSYILAWIYGLVFARSYSLPGLGHIATGVIFGHCTAHARMLFSRTLIKETHVSLFWTFQRSTLLFYACFHSCPRLLDLYRPGRLRLAHCAGKTPRRGGLSAGHGVSGWVTRHLIWRATAALNPCQAVHHFTPPLDWDQPRQRRWCASRSSWSPFPWTAAVILEN